MSTTLSISAAESIVMEALWKSSSSLSAEDIIALVAHEQEWTEATVRTLINRLLKKKVIAAKKDGRKFLYRPVLKRADWVHRESQGLLDRLFDGKLAPLVTHFSERRKLSREDVRELKKLIGEIEDDR